MENKITIIEGPTPVFEPVGDGWAMGLNESQTIGSIVLTRLRTFNGPALVERCYRAWHSQQAIHLEYREEDGLISHKPIVAARNIDTPEGQILLLWVRLPETDIEVELEFDDDSDEDPGEGLPPDDRM